jgi:hydrogenase maturation protein HypF
LNKEKDFIARKVINGLAELVYQISDIYECNQLAFSGGVFQNALLVDTLLALNKGERLLYFQKNVSPNDEGISLGQLAYYLNEKHHLTNQQKATVANPATEQLARI